MIPKHIIQDTSTFLCIVYPHQQVQTFKNMRNQQNGTYLLFKILRWCICIFDLGFISPLQIYRDDFLECSLLREIFIEYSKFTREQTLSVIGHVVKRIKSRRAHEALSLEVLEISLI